MNFKNFFKLMLVIVLTIVNVLMVVASFVMLIEKEPVANTMLVVFSCTTAVSIVEIVRIIKNRKHIILPMIGMYFMSFLLGLTVGFVIETIQGDSSSIGPAITYGLFFIISALGAYGIHKGRNDNNKSYSDVGDISKIRSI